MSRRTRIFRSSSQGEFGVFNQLRPIESPVARWDEKYTVEEPVANPATKPVKNWKTSVPKQEQPRRCIFTIGSPSLEKNDAGSKKEPEETKDARSQKKPDERLASFLECCFLCNKQFAEEKGIHMYGYLRGFCSPKCRDDQMALDGFDKEIDKEDELLRKSKDTTRKTFGTQFKPYSFSKHK